MRPGLLSAPHAVEVQGIAASRSAAARGARRLGRRRRAGAPARRRRRPARRRDRALRAARSGSPAIDEAGMNSAPAACSERGRRGTVRAWNGPLRPRAKACRSAVPRCSAPSSPASQASPQPRRSTARLGRRAEGARRYRRPPPRPRRRLAYLQRPVAAAPLRPEDVRAAHQRTRRAARSRCAGARSRRCRASARSATSTA